MNATQTLDAQGNWPGGLGCAELGSGKGDPGLMEKLIARQVHPQSPLGASIPTLWKAGDSPICNLCPSCLQEQVGTSYCREGKAKMGGSVLVPRPHWLKSILRGVLFIAPTTSFLAPHQIRKV